MNNLYLQHIEYLLLDWKRAGFYSDYMQKEVRLNGLHLINTLELDTPEMFGDLIFKGKGGKEWRVYVDRYVNAIEWGTCWMNSLEAVNEATKFLLEAILTSRYWVLSPNVLEKNKDHYHSFPNMDNMLPLRYYTEAPYRGWYDSSRVKHFKDHFCWDKYSSTNKKDAVNKLKNMINNTHYYPFSFFEGGVLKPLLPSTPNIKPLKR